GDFDPKTAQALIKKYFGDIPKGAAIPRNKVVEPAMTAEVRDVVYDKIQLPAVIQAYRIPAYGSKDFYAVDMLNRLLSNGNSSRLQKSVKDAEQKALYIGSFSLPFEQPGLAIAFGIANMNVSPDSLEKSMDREFERVRKEPVSAEELAKLKAQIETEFVSGNARMAGIAENLASAYTFLGDTKKIDTEIQQYLAVTAADLQRVANQYFIPTNRVVLYYLPQSQKQ
ncbi:MAG TPA: insulinase family protein, partial [Flavobacteriales bacterium]|nr:insulinase family protein [Flavobacteriales bacterium]